MFDFIYIIHELIYSDKLHFPDNMIELSYELIKDISVFSDTVKNLYDGPEESGFFIIEK